MGGLSDNHVHFTGALPLSFIWEKLNQNIEKNRFEDFSDVWEKLFPTISVSEFIGLSENDRTSYYQDFKQSLALFFCENYKLNYNLFFKLYSFVQSFTKEIKHNKFWNLYKDGTYSIANKYIKQGVFKYQIIAGANTNETKTINRILAMSEGLDMAEAWLKKKEGGIRITFIRDKEGFRNFSHQSLKSIFDLIEKKVTHRIKGFDFSGEENLKNISQTKEIVEEINSFNRHRKKRRLNTFPISIHAGENFINFDNESLLDYFYQLSQLDINIICHGTFLWIPSYRISISNYHNIERFNILKKISDKSIAFEICPTANKIMTPLKYTDINHTLFDKYSIDYSVNTDNPTFFSTNIYMEHKRISYGK